MSISEHIINTIESQVRDGILLPGDTISEDKLIEEFNVSRTPVRDALLKLQAKGLVHNLGRAGIVIAKMDVQQLLAMWELLAELESLCARYACERMSNEEREELKELHEDTKSIVEANDEIGWQTANLEFHEALYHGSRNPYLRKEILKMRLQTGAYRKHAFGAVGRLQASYAHHTEILKAILNQDSKLAAERMFHHMSPGHGTRGVTDMIAQLPRSLLK